MVNHTLPDWSKSRLYIYKTLVLKKKLFSFEKKCSKKKLERKPLLRPRMFLPLTVTFLLCLHCKSEQKKQCCIFWQSHLINYNYIKVSMKKTPENRKNWTKVWCQLNSLNISREVRYLSKKLYVKQLFSVDATIFQKY